MNETESHEVELAPSAPPSAKARKMGRKGPRWRSPKFRAGTLRRDHTMHGPGGGDWCSCSYEPRKGVTAKARARSRHRSRVHALGKEVKRA